MMMLMMMIMMKHELVKVAALEMVDEAQRRKVSPPSPMMEVNHAFLASLVLVRWVSWQVTTMTMVVVESERSVRLMATLLFLVMTSQLLLAVPPQMMMMMMMIASLKHPWVLTLQDDELG